MKLSYRSISILILMVISSIFSSCDYEKEGLPLESSDVYTLDDISLPNLSLLSEEIIPGTLATDIMLKSEQAKMNEKGEAVQCGHNDDDDDDDGDDGEGDDGDDDDEGENDNHNNGCKNGIKYLGQILNHLELTKEQRKQIYELKHGYKDCLKLAKKEIQKRKKTIIANANKEKCEIEKKLKKKEITKSEAKNLIKSLNERTQTALNELLNAIEIKVCVCDFLRNIISLLDEVQANELINYIANEHPEFECDFLITDPPVVN